LPDSDFEKYLKNKRILILDKSNSVRSLIEKALIRMGAQEINISSFKNYENALNNIQTTNPHIVVADFSIHDKFGLDLLPYTKNNDISIFEKIFMVVTENSDDSSVADAAEEEVDGYLLKPFSAEIYIAYLRKIIHRKLNPSTYTKTILAGKAALAEGNFTQAISLFEQAILETDTPTVAMYYLGHIAYMNDDLPKALSCYKRALSVTPLHFKSLLGEFLIYLEQKNNETAYEKIQFISRYYPLSPQLLKFALLLCITNYDYDEVERYFDRYMKLERKPDDLKRVVSQSLLASGIHLLKKNETKEAVGFFLKGAIINGRTPEYLNKVVDILLKNKLIKEAEQYIGMFDDDDLGSTLYKQLLFTINAEKHTYDKVLEEGRQLINDEEASPEVFLKVLKILKTTENDRMLENIAFKAMEQFPDQRSKFKEYLPD
jgi:DNA-binding NarL/FixJ family response regulator/uncharacterized protein Yka (UPF0111/DUF47 family)